MKPRWTSFPPRALAGLIALLVWGLPRIASSGPDDVRAQNALKVASQAVDAARQACTGQAAPDQLEKSLSVLEDGRNACERTEYAACSRLADQAWALARLVRQACQKRQTDKNRFAVSVTKGGTTRIAVLEGDGIKVTAGKRSTTVRRGESVNVHTGQAPGEVKKLPDPPELILPFDESVLITPSLHFHWKVAAEARQYVLTISRDAAGLVPVRQIVSFGVTYLLQSDLPNGQYHWFVRSVNANNDVSAASASRRFTLRVEDQPSVTVQPAPEKSDPETQKEQP